jgi:hypothetical protein
MNILVGLILKQKLGNIDRISDFRFLLVRLVKKLAPDKPHISNSREKNNQTDRSKVKERQTRESVIHQRFPREQVGCCTD